MESFKAGVYINQGTYKSFQPNPIFRSWELKDMQLINLLTQADRALGKLDMYSYYIPNIELFIKMHITKEATQSSKIEGTQTNIEEAIIDEKDINPEKRDDWQEVNNYVKAMNKAIEELKTLPLSNRLIKNTHQVLLSSGRGVRKTPGDFRTSQNWIGGTSLSDAIFIPPAHIELPDLLSDLENFLNNTDLKVPHLIRIAIAHYQFETIHPFLDGNGRIGRLLITLYLVSNGILEKPLLYLSDFFEKNKNLYYDNLTLVRSKNDLARWVKFFLIGVITTAEQSVKTLGKIIDLKANIEKNHIIGLGKRSKQALELFHQLFTKPVINVSDVQKMTGLSTKAANNLVGVLVEQNILKETTGYQRNRIFVFDEYLKLF